jgi:hypothetical protein
MLHNGPWQLTSQLIRYQYDPKNPAGVSDDRASASEPPSSLFQPPP